LKILQFRVGKDQQSGEIVKDSSFCDFSWICPKLHSLISKFFDLLKILNKNVEKSNFLIEKWFFYHLQKIGR